jgi:hypothetical protein
MPPVTQTELENAQLDCQTLADVVNLPATAPDVVTRLGNSIKPLAKVLAEIAAEGGSGGTITITGDVDGSGESTITVTLTDRAVSYAKIQETAGAGVLGAAAAGPVRLLGIGDGLSIVGTNLTANPVALSNGDHGDITVTGGGAGLSIKDRAVQMKHLPAAPSVGIIVAPTGSGSYVHAALGLGFNISGSSASGYTINFTGGGGGGGSTLLPDGDYGDIVVSGSGHTLSIDSSVISAAARNILDDATAAAMLSSLGGQIGDATLSALAGVAWGGGSQILLLTGPDTVTLATVGTATGNIPNAEGVMDLISSTVIPGAGLTAIYDDVADQLKIVRDDRASYSPECFYLPQIFSSGAAYHCVASTERLIPGYSGALANIGTDLGVGASGITATEIAQARAGGSSPVRIVTLYDQSGGGRNLTQATSARRAGFHDSVLLRGKPMILFDGKRSDIGNPHPVGFDATLSLNSRSNTRIMLIDPTASIIPQTFERCDTGSGKNLYTYTPPSPPYTPDQNGNIQYGDGGAAFGSTFKAPAQPFVLAVRDRSAGQDVFVNGVKSSTTNVPAAATLTAFHWGYSSGVGLDQFWANMRGTTYLTISGDVTDHEIQQITRCLLHRWNIQRTKAPIVSLQGNSIEEGVAADLTCNLPFWIRDILGQFVELYNWGVAGKYLQHTFANLAVLHGSVYQSDRPFIAVIPDGINDLHAGLSTGANLYNNWLIPTVNYVKALGTNARAVVCTLLPQTANVTSSIEAERVAYNNLITTGSLVSDTQVFICDIARDPRMGVYPTTPNDLNLMPDHIHPSRQGYSYLAPVYAATIRAAIASVN